MRWAVFLLLFLLPALALADPAWILLPGQGYGPVRLGQKESQVQDALGQATEVQPTSDGQGRLKTYARQVMLLLNADREVIGITVFAREARTSQGLGVGSSQAEVQKTLGVGLPRGPGQVAYPGSGIGFAFDSRGLAERIFLFKPEASQALQGDRQIVAGRRCGDLQVGMSASQVLKAWGKAPVQKGPNQQWPDKGVGLLMEGGRVLAITITTGDYITAKGLKVGSLKSEVLAIYGPPQQAEGGNLLYPRFGIAFYLVGEMVSTVQIFAPIQP